MKSNLSMARYFGRAWVLFGWLGAFWLAVVTLRAEEAPSRSASPVPLEWRGLDNVFRLSPRITSGSGPNSEPAFATLAEQGITTIVSVDGERPDVERAHKYGMRYVHIPIGYDGLPRAAQLALVRVARETNGTIYIHCHHGKHRGPAAAAVACIAEGSVDRAAAKHILSVAGTAANYRGLWRDVEKFNLPHASEELPDLVEVADVGGMALAMVQASAAIDQLQQLSDNQWRPLADRPDVGASDESLLLWEAFREAERFASSSDDELLSEDLVAAKIEAARLHESLTQGDLESAVQRFMAIKANCTACHVTHRDNQ